MGSRIAIWTTPTHCGKYARTLHTVTGRLLAGVTAAGYATTPWPIYVEPGDVGAALHVVTRAAQARGWEVRDGQ